jgi:hypothetical protein
LVNGFEVKFFSDNPSYSGFESHPNFVFSTEIVLLACRGRQVSFYTTVGGGEWCQFINRPARLRWQNKGAIKRLC